MQKALFSFLLIFGTIPVFGLVRDSSVLKTPTGNIYGTLTLPAKKFSGPIAIIISGSASTDRHGNNGLLINNTLQILSDSLAKYGIASLRYDKRGIGSSKAAAKDESHILFSDYVKDLNGWTAKFAGDRRFTKIFIIGHSEGSLVGILGSRQKNIAGFVSIEGAGRRADLFILDQLKENPNATSTFLDSCRLIFDEIRLDGQADNVPAGFYQTMFRKTVQRYLSSWLKYDPSKEIAALKIPTLIIQGRRDLQVNVAEAHILADAKPDAELVLIPEMNHIFRNLLDDDVSKNTSSYFDAGSPIDRTLVSSIVRFIRTNMGGK